MTVSTREVQTRPVNATSAQLSNFNVPMSAEDLQRKGEDRVERFYQILIKHLLLLLKLKP